MEKNRIAELERLVDTGRGDRNAISRELGDFLVSNSKTHGEMHGRATTLLAKISPEFAKHGMASLLANQVALAHNVANSSFDGAGDPHAL